MLGKVSEKSRVKREREERRGGREVTREEKEQGKGEKNVNTRIKILIR